MSECAEYRNKKEAMRPTNPAGEWGRFFAQMPAKTSGPRWEEWLVSGVKRSSNTIRGSPRDLLLQLGSGRNGVEFVDAGTGKAESATPPNLVAQPDLKPGT